MKNPTLLMLAVLLLLVSACDPSRNSPPPPVSNTVQNSVNAPAIEMQPSPVALAIVATIPGPAQVADISLNKSGGNTPGDTTASTRIVLKNAALVLTVNDPGQTVSQVTQMAEAMGGWVVASNATTAVQDNHQIVEATISVRVPADKFSGALEQIKGQALSVDGENITGDDVTDKYVDLNSQLSNLEATEAQLQKIMATATKIDDVLTVQNKLTEVQGQIAVIKGQLKYYSDAAAYSLISLTLKQKPPAVSPTPTPTITPTPTPKPLGLIDWNPGQTVTSAADTLVGLVQGGITLLIWLVIVFGPLAVILAILWLILRRRTPSRPSQPQANP